MDGIYKKPVVNPDNRCSECEPTFALDRHVNEARREMGEARWAELNAEWPA